MKDLLTELFENLGLACWVEIKTNQPNCTYYFGPFLTKKDAQIAKQGYVEDLENEGAQGITIKVKRCKPEQLTIFDEEDSATLPKVPSLSGQVS